MDGEWADRVASTALATLNIRKLNMTTLLPLTSDLIKLNTFLDENIKKIKLTIEV